MKFTIEFSIYAVETYDSIKNQLEAQWGEKVLYDFEERTTKVLTNIQMSPFMFQAVDNHGLIRKAVIHGNCSVLYEIKESEIKILFFWDNRQEPIL